MDEISEELGRVMTPHLFEISTSTHYGRMVMTDDNTVMLFGDMNEMIEIHHLTIPARDARPALRRPGQPDASLKSVIIINSGGGENAMYRTAKGEEIFVIDGHTHFWDGSPANQKNIHGKQFIECFYAYHSNLSPPSEKWKRTSSKSTTRRRCSMTCFVTGYDDMAILQPTYLTDFYKNGFNTTERNSAMKKNHPDRFILNGAFDPRDGSKGLEDLHALSEKHKLKGVKLYTAEWRGESKGYKLTDKESYKYLEAAQKLGIKNIHVHKGPTIIPLNRDAFDVADIDDGRDFIPGSEFHCRALRLAAAG